MAAKAGTVYAVDAAGADIVGFDPAKDKLDLGGVSVHNFIVVDTPTGVGFLNPWSGDMLIVKGVSLGQLTVDSFEPIENAHLRECLSGALAWEQGVEAEPNTVYARCHELGQIDRVAFDPATDVVDFRYYGSREQITMTDGADGVIISNTGTGQSLILLGVTKAELTVENFRFYYAEVREDRVHLQLGIGTVPDSQIVDQDVPIAGTNDWPTGVGAGDPPTGVEGETFSIAWLYGVNSTIDFDPAADTLDFGWFKASEFSIAEVGGSTVITIVGNNQTYTLTGVSLAELTMSNITALATDARAEWQTVLDGAEVSTPTLSVSDARRFEGDDNSHFLTFTVTLSEASDGPVTVDYATISGTAKAGEDFRGKVGTLTFDAGEVTQTVRVRILGDDVAEKAEKMSLVLTNASGATVADDMGVGTIRNDDGAAASLAIAAAPTISIIDAAVTEADAGEQVIQMVVRLSQASDEEVSVSYATRNGLATARVDYEALVGTMTFAPGETEKAISFTVLNDTLIELTESFTVMLSSATGATISKTSATAYIVDNDVDAEPDVLPEITIENMMMEEGDDGMGHLHLTVTLSKASTETVTVHYSTRDGSAVGGEDYQITQGTVTFAPGETTQTIMTHISGDLAVEGDETFRVKLSDATNATIADGMGVAMIMNDDLPSIAVSNARVTEGDMGARLVTFTVTLSEAAERAVTVDYASEDLRAVAGEDYVAKASQITFEPGETVKTVTMRVLGDKLVEGREGFRLQLSNPDGATLADDRGLATIVDNDVAASARAALGSGTGSVEYDVTQAWSGGFTAEMVVAAGTGGLDGWTVEFDAGFEITNIWNAVITSHVGTHYVIENAAYNGDVSGGSTVAFGFQGGSGSTSITGLELNGDDSVALPDLAVSNARVVEGNDGSAELVFTVSLSEAATDRVTVEYDTANGTARAGSDFTAGAGKLTFAAGETTKEIRVSVTGDTVQETNERMRVLLSDAVGASISDGLGRGTIVNDDEAGADAPAVSISDAKVTEGTAAAGWLSTSGNQIIDAAGNTVQIAGVNWFGFEGTNMNPNGLWTRNYQDMMKQMMDEGFNTIRLPFSSEMLHASTASGIDYAKNPDLQGLTPLEIMDKIVAYAEEIGIKIILDHHRSSAGNGTSANGLWYDSEYTQDEWVADWQMLAERYADNTAVIGADLHNEPYNGTWGGGGDKDWALAAETAGNAIGEVNSNWLIFVEGVATYKGENYWWGGNLMGVRDRPIDLNLDNKLVYSAHDYPQTVYDQSWFSDANYPDNLMEVFDNAWGYIYREGIAPVYLGEFGTKLTETKDIQWFDAITAYLGGDFDNDGVKDIGDDVQGISWTYWSWNPNSGDTGGILKDDWTTVNDNKMVYLTPIESDFPDLGEGGDATVYATFKVTLTEAADTAVSVSWHTAAGSATAADFASDSGKIIFKAGETTKTIKIAITGDMIAEADERFVVVLGNPVGVKIKDGRGTGTIVDDDAATSSLAKLAADGTESDLDWALTVLSSSDGGFTARVDVHNAGEAVQDWQLTLDLPATITSVTGAELLSGNADSFVIASLDDADALAKGGDTSFVITGTTALDPVQLDLLF